MLRKVPHHLITMPSTREYIANFHIECLATMKSRPNRRGYCVRFNQDVFRSDGSIGSLDDAPEREKGSLPLTDPRARQPELHYPDYNEPLQNTRRVADNSIPPHVVYNYGTYASERRGSDDSDTTLYEEEGDINYPAHDIQPPPAAYIVGQGPHHPPGLVAPLRFKKKTSIEKPVEEDLPVEDDCAPQTDREFDMPSKNGQGGGGGIISTLADMYNSENYDEADYPPEDIERADPIEESIRAGRMARTDSEVSDDSAILDPDDPVITGVVRRHLDDQEDLENNVMRYMSYRARRKERARLKIQFNITCEWSILLPPL